MFVWPVLYWFYCPVRLRPNREYCRTCASVHSFQQNCFMHAYSVLYR